VARRDVAFLSTEDLVIDLSTFIALLTALASATASSPTAPASPRADDPPGQHCRAAHSRSGEGPHRAPDRPRTIIMSAPPSRSNVPTDRPEGSGKQPRNNPLRGGTHDDTTDNDTTDNDKTDGDTTHGDTTHGDETDEEARTPTTTSPPLPNADPADDSDDDSNPTTGRSDADHRSASRSPSTTTRPRSTKDPTGERAEDDQDDEEDTDPATGTAGGQRGSPSGETPRVRPGDDPGSRASTRDPEPRPAPTGRPDNRSSPGGRCEEPPADRPSDRPPDEPADQPTGDVAVPSDLVDLKNWYLTLPTGADGNPDTVQPAELAGYTSTYFQLNEERDGVVFTAPVDGVTTKNSSYPRSELREMEGTDEASWSNASGTHMLRATEAVTELPRAKPELVTAQIHGGDDDVMQIRLEGTHMMVRYDDGAKQVTLDPNYRLGTPYDIEIVAADNAVRVRYNGEQKADLPLSGSTWYFKAGAYVQSNPSKGDTAAAAGQVIIYSLEVDHT
jgi:poly(beta-D-mannuronate) lyase